MVTITRPEPKDAFSNVPEGCSSPAAMNFWTDRTPADGEREIVQDYLCRSPFG